MATEFSQVAGDYPSDLANSFISFANATGIDLSNDEIWQPQFRAWLLENNQTFRLESAPLPVGTEDEETPTDPDTDPETPVEGISEQTIIRMIFEQADAYDAEYHIGLIADSTNAAIVRQNVTRWNAANEAMHTNGNFAFPHGITAGPVLKPIRFAAKEFFTAGTVIFPPRAGGAVYGAGGRSYELPSDQFTSPTGMGGARTQITRVDGDKTTNGKTSVIRLCGSGVKFEGFSVFGRRYAMDNTGEGPDGPLQAGSSVGVGTRTPACIDIEGRISMVTGMHIIRDCLIAEGINGIRMLAGYYNSSGVFVPDENHGESGIVDSTMFSGCDSCIRSENQQAVVWLFNNIQAFGFGGAGLNPMTIFNCLRGGNFEAHAVSALHPMITILDVTDYSPFTASFEISGVKWDHVPGLTHYCTLFKYSGPVYDDMRTNSNWRVRMQGHLAAYPEGTDTDITKVIQIPDSASTYGVRREDLLFDFKYLPIEDQFDILGDGPWYTPKYSYTSG